MDYHRKLLRSDIIECIDEFIDRCKDYNNKISTTVNMKRSKTGFLCIVTVKKLVPDSNRDKTISKCAMRVVKHSDLDVLQSLFQRQFQFVKDCYTKITF